MSKIFASFQPSDFSPAITNSQAMAEVVGAIRSQYVTMSDRVTNLSTNHLHVQRQTQSCPEAIAFLGGGICAIVTSIT